mgnify:CR=1 FL=1
MAFSNPFDDHHLYSSSSRCCNFYTLYKNKLKKPVIKLFAKLLTIMEPLLRFELRTPALQVRCSGQLS